MKNDKTPGDKAKRQIGGRQKIDGHFMTDKFHVAHGLIDRAGTLAMPFFLVDWKEVGGSFLQFVDFDSLPNRLGFSRTNIVKRAERIKSENGKILDLRMKCERCSSVIFPSSTCTTMTP